MNPLDMTGFWVGAYWYDMAGQPVVRFIANIEERDCRLSGSTSEPNTSTRSGSRLSAFIDGMRSDNSVSFAKVYDGSGDAMHRVDYSGQLTGDGTSVSGSWTLQDWTGGFEMTRPPLPKADVKIETLQTVDIGQR